MTIPLDLSGEVCLVTGAAGGIGQAIVERLSSAGAVVIAADVDAAALHECYADNRDVTTTAFDVTDAGACHAAVHAAVGAVGDVSVVVNNAGVASRVGLPFTRLEAEDWDLPWRVNVVGSFNASKAVVEGMCAARHGAIVNVASVSGRTGFPTSPAYSASKAAVINFTQVMARDLAAFNVRVNAVCPGMVLTPFYRAQRLAAAEHDPVIAAMTDEEYFADKASRLIPLGRGQQPGEIADTVCFLASPLASAITGQALNVDGGLVMS